MEQIMLFKDIIKSITDDDIIDDVQYLKNNTEKIKYHIKKYQDTLSINSRKSKGCFYTHESIINYILDSLLKDIDLVHNPYIRILDPSCGCGYFLTAAYDILKSRYTLFLHDINSNNPELNLRFENIHEHILEFNLFGADLDENAVKMAALSLMIKKPESRKMPNILCCDSIIDWKNTLFEPNYFWSKKFHIIVGNPPYIGHKKLSGGYRKELNKIYQDVFKDKADISFCFIKSSIDRLTNGGKLCFITSRYFIESPSGKALRKYVRDNCIIEKIIDFYGVRIMKGISVDPIIITLTKADVINENEIYVIKATNQLKNIDENQVFNNINERTDNRYYRHFYVPQYNLNDEGWVLCSQDEMSIIKKIEKKLSYRLSDICSSFQGIITGCDKAFIVDDYIIDKFSIEKCLVKRWIKNSNIKKYRVDNTRLYIIYSDFIDDIEKYPGAASCIEIQRGKLEKRRECQRGVRKWYQLQWGRDYNLFESKKIVFPYKSSTNRFAIDRGSYGSADIYGMHIKPEFFDRTSYEFLLGILNSKLYEFYFKSFGKKLGDNLYDYYPNTVMRLMVPLSNDDYITSMIEIITNDESIEKDRYSINEINVYLYELFGIDKNEIKLIEERCAE